MFNLQASNVSAAAKFIKLYNKASAPTVGTDVPVLIIPIPATSHISIDFGIMGQRFSTGIAYAITNLIAANDTTVIAAGDVRLMLSYT